MRRSSLHGLGLSLLALTGCMAPVVDANKEDFDGDVSILAAEVNDAQLQELLAYGTEVTDFDQLYALAEETAVEGPYEETYAEEPAATCWDDYGYEYDCSDIGGQQAALAGAAVPVLVIGIGITGYVIVTGGLRSQQTWYQRTATRVDLEGQSGPIPVDVPQSVVELFREPFHSFRHLSPAGFLLMEAVARLQGRQALDGGSVFASRLAEQLPRREDCVAALGTHPPALLAAAGNLTNLPSYEAAPFGTHVFACEDGAQWIVTPRELRRLARAPQGTNLAVTFHIYGDIAIYGPAFPVGYYGARRSWTRPGGDVDSWTTVTGVVDDHLDLTDGIQLQAQRGPRYAIRVVRGSP